MLDNLKAMRCPLVIRNVNRDLKSYKPCEHIFMLKEPKIVMINITFLTSNFDKSCIPLSH